MTLTWEPLLMILLLVGVVWLKQYLDRKEAYRDGASHGFVLGVDRTIKIMVEQHLVARDPDGPFLTADELITKLGPVITNSVIKEAERLQGKA